MPGPDMEMEEYQAAAPAAEADAIFTVMLVVAAAFFVAALVFSYLEYSEFYAEKPVAEVTE